MSNLEDIYYDEIDDNLTSEEEQKIESIQKVSSLQFEKKEVRSYSIWSLFGFDQFVIVPEVKRTLKNVPFDIQRRVGMNKVVTINNISGKNAYVILTSTPIKTLKSIGVGCGEGSLDISFDDTGEYKAQKFTILNNTSSTYDLDNSRFYCTLFLNVDGNWKKTWENRRFNGRKFDINILEKHAISSLDKDNVPDF